jgi:hypothetical protein
MLSVPLFPHQDVIVAVYVFLLCVCTTLPFYSIIPVFKDVNRGPGLVALNTCLYYFYAPAITVFNATFAGYFYIKIGGWRLSGVGKLEQHPKMLVLAYKSAIHAVTR